MGRLGLVLLVAASTAWAQNKPVVPAVPTFEVIVPSAKSLGARQLKALGRRDQVGGTVTVRGYVTGIYDCVDANLEPFKTRAQIANEVAADPKKCEPPKFFVGDAKSTPVEHSLRIADVPAGVAWKVGDYVEVVGKFGFTSPNGDKDREGLVAYASAQKVKPEAGTKLMLPPAHAVIRLTPPKPLRPSPPPGEKMRSVGLAMQDARRYVEWLQWKEAQAEYKRIVATWDGNAIAWAELGNAYDQPGMFAEAADAYGHAFALVPTQAEYAFLYGRALWLRDFYAARNAEAKRQGIHEEYLELSGAEAKLNLDKAQQLLEYSIKLAPDDWRAHATLANIYAANEDWRVRAEELTNAILRGPKDYDPYWQLAMLYHQWGYEDEAIRVVDVFRATPGIDPSDTRPYEVAAKAYEAKGDIKKAIEMLSIVRTGAGSEIDQAAIERARLYIATKQYDKARAELDAFPLHNKSKMREVNVLLAKIPATKSKR